MKVLVVEDDQTVAQALQHLLSSYHYAVDVAADGETGLQMVQAFDYDLVLLDVFLPGLDGIGLCHQLRSEDFLAPILLLTGQDDGHQKAIALNAGADDYVVKPFEAEELIARIQALLRRGGPKTQPILTWGQIQIDPSRRSITYGTQPLTPTPKEFAILELFLRNPQTIFSSGAILNQVWESTDAPGEEAVRVHIMEIRKKLRQVGAPKDLIKTMPRTGYGLNSAYANEPFEHQPEPSPLSDELTALSTAQADLQDTLAQLRSARAELAQIRQALPQAPPLPPAALPFQSPEAIHQREERLRLALELTAIGTWDWQIDRDVVTWNDNHYRLYGYQPGEVEPSYQLCRQHVHPEDAAQMEQALTQALEQQTDYRAEYRVVLQDGTVRWLTGKGRALYDDQGHPKRMVGIIFDITDRKQLELTAQDTQTQLKEVLDSAIAGIIRLRVYPDASIQYDYISPHCEQNFGYTVTELMPGAELWRSRIHSKDWTTVVQPTVQAILKRRGPSTHVIEYRFHRKDGTTCWILAKYFAQWNDVSQYWYVTVVETDISNLKQAEQALRKSETRWQFALEGAGDGIWDWDTQTSTVFYSSQWKAMLGYSEQDVGNTLSEWDSRVHPEDKARCYADLDRHSTGETPLYQNEHRLRCKDGSYKWVLARGKVLERTATGRPRRIIGTHTDITDRKQAEAHLQELTQRLALATDAADIGVWELDLVDDVLMYDQRMYDLYGLNPDSFGGTYESWRCCVHPDDLPAVEVEVEAAIAGDREFHTEFRIVRPDGQIRHLESHGIVLRDRNNKALRSIGVNWDITTRKLTEERVWEQAALLDIASDAIVVRSLDQHVLYWNQGAERLYGWLATEAMGQQANVLLQTDPEQLDQIMHHLLDQGEWQGESHQVTQQGQTVTVAGRWTLARDETGQPKFILSVDTDITEKKQLEAQFYQAQRLESLGQLASGIAHDLNNIFTPILSMSQLLRLTEPDLAPQAQERLQLVEDSARRGTNMVKQILTFVRGGGGDRTLVDLGALLQEVIPIVQQSFPKSIAIHQGDRPSAPMVVSADPTHLHQVVMNLCINARDAMPEGGTLTLTAALVVVDEAMAQRHLEAQVGTYGVITVTDTGTGIPPAVCDRMFEPFFTTKPPGQSIGFGLATVRGIVSSYEGFLRVSSQVGHGTQIQVYLPTATGSPTLEQQQPQQFNGQGALVLVVEDDPAVRQSTQALLESHHYATITVSNGQAAIAQFNRHRSQLKTVIVDVMMPNMDGVALIQALVAEDDTVNIIAISGLPENRQVVLAAGAKAFLAKPYRLDQLLEAVSHLDIR